MTDPLEAQAAMMKAALDMAHAAMKKPAPRTYTQAQWDMALQCEAANSHPSGFWDAPQCFYPCDKCGYPINKADVECPICFHEHNRESDRDREGMFDDSFVNGFNQGR